MYCMLTFTGREQQRKRFSEWGLDPNRRYRSKCILSLSWTMNPINNERNWSKRQSLSKQFVKFLWIGINQDFNYRIQIVKMRVDKVCHLFLVGARDEKEPKNFEFPSDREKEGEPILNNSEEPQLKNHNSIISSIYNCSNLISVCW